MSLLFLFIVAVSTTPKTFPKSMDLLLRRKRFHSVEQPVAVSERWFDGDNHNGIGSEFLDAWRERNQALVSHDKYSTIYTQAREGILEEGRIVGKEEEAQQLVSDLITEPPCQGHFNSAAYGFTLNTFLYGLVNLTLKNADRSKVDTLGAFCWLLFAHVYLQSESEKELTVYRGCQLTRQMIDDYKQFQGRWIKWLAFLSTPKDRNVAECFGNTLFIIRLPKGCMCSRDISAVSHFDDEEEVLLNAGHAFSVLQVENIKPDPTTQSEKYVIHMKAY